jgi:hypothetical protein
MMAIIFVAGVTAHMVNSKQGAKWFIYMTDQVSMLSNFFTFLLMLRLK